MDVPIKTNLKPKKTVKPIKKKVDIPTKKIMRVKQNTGIALLGECYYLLSESTQQKRFELNKAKGRKMYTPTK